jgi:hypothetical protein
MATVTQYTFGLKEVTEILIKSSGIHEGKWMLAIEFGVNVGMLGMSQASARPGVMVLANNLMLAVADPGAPADLIVDAAEVNPRT